MIHAPLTHGPNLNLPGNSGDRRCPTVKQDGISRDPRIARSERDLSAETVPARHRGEIVEAIQNTHPAALTRTEVTVREGLIAIGCRFAPVGARGRPAPRRAWSGEGRH